MLYEYFNINNKKGIISNIFISMPTARGYTAKLIIVWFTSTRECHLMKVGLYRNILWQKLCFNVWLEKRSLAGSVRWLKILQSSGEGSKGFQRVLECSRGLQRVPWVPSVSLIYISMGYFLTGVGGSETDPNINQAFFLFLLVPRGFQVLRVLWTFWTHEPSVELREFHGTLEPSQIRPLKRCMCHVYLLLQELPLGPQRLKWEECKRPTYCRCTKKP